VFNNNGIFMTMLNPEITAKSGPYDTEEGCLSLLGGPRPTKRFRRITVKYQSLDMQWHTGNFDGWTAQIIQHEVDHCNGILI
jgi:peptide deformylase